MQATSAADDAGQAGADQVHQDGGQGDTAADEKAAAAGVAGAVQPPAPTPPGGTALYEVASPLDHDGTRYAIGESITLSEAQAKELLGHTVIGPVAA